MTKKKAISSKTHEAEPKKELKSDKKKIKTEVHKKHPVEHKKDEMKIMEETKPQEDLQISMKNEVEIEEKTEDSAVIKPKFELSGKQLNIIIVIVALLVLASGAFGLYLIKQNANLKNNPPSSQNTPKQSDNAKISDDEIKSIQDLAITPDFPDLKPFSTVLNKGSALPVDHIDPDKRDGFKGGTEVTLASEVDRIGKRMALVQSVSLYSEEAAKKLNIKDYKQDGFTKQECADVADECVLFYRAPLTKNTTVDTQRIYFRKKGFVFYFEFAKSNVHPEYDVNWLKKLSNDLANKVK
jgi:hypothetical protein